MCSCGYHSRISNDPLCAESVNTGRISRVIFGSLLVIAVVVNILYNNCQ